jgi:hypothetical protein
MCENWLIRQSGSRSPRTRIRVSSPGIAGASPYQISRLAGCGKRSRNVSSR